MNGPKAALISEIDAAIALPGFGALDEIACLWASTAFGTRPRPIGLVNTLGLFDPFCTSSVPQPQRDSSTTTWTCPARPPPAGGRPAPGA
jgi:hypothetical protein